MTTAERFVDEMNTRRVLRERALDQEHFDGLVDELELSLRAIWDRYRDDAVELPADEAIQFGDASRAGRIGERWVVWTDDTST